MSGAIKPEHYPMKNFSALSGQEALSVLAEQTVDLIKSDMRMPGMSGAEFLSLVKDKCR